MISRAAIVRAAGVFITSTVVFAALIVIAGGLGFSGQPEEFLPTVERALPGDGPGEIVFEDGSGTLPVSDIGHPFRVPASVVTAEPATPKQLAAASPDDTSAVTVIVPQRPGSATRQHATPAPTPQQAPPPSPSPEPSPPSSDDGSSDPASESPSPTPSEGATRFEEPPEQWSEPASPSPEPAPSSEPTPDPSPEPSASPTSVDQATELASEATASP